MPGLIQDLKVEMITDHVAHDLQDSLQHAPSFGPSKQLRNQKGREFEGNLEVIAPNIDRESLQVSNSSQGRESKQGIWGFVGGLKGI